MVAIIIKDNDKVYAKYDVEGVKPELLMSSIEDAIARVKRYEFKFSNDKYEVKCYRSEDSSECYTCIFRVREINFASIKNCVRLDEIVHLFMDMRKNESDKVLFKYIVIENLKTSDTVIVPEELVELFKEYLWQVGDKYIPNPEFFDDELLRILLRCVDELVSVARDEIPDIRSGVLGSLVRKGILSVFSKNNSIYYVPTNNSGRVNRREREALNKIWVLYHTKAESMHRFAEELLKQHPELKDKVEFLLKLLKA